MKKLYCYCKTCRESFTIYIKQDEEGIPSFEKCPHCHSSNIVED